MAHPCRARPRSLPARRGSPLELPTGTAAAREPMARGPRAPAPARAAASARGVRRDRGEPRPDGRARGRRAAAARAREPQGRAGVDPLRRLGPSRRRDPRERRLAALPRGGGGAGPDRDGLRAQARGALSRAPVRAGVSVRALEPGLHLPARDERRRRAHARDAGERRAARRGAAASALPRSGARLDERAVDDGAHRRLGRRSLGDRREAHARGLAALGREVVHVGGELRSGAHAGPARGQRARRQGSRALPRAHARCAGSAESRARAAAQGEARDAQRADGGARARSACPDCWSRAPATACATWPRC